MTLELEKLVLNQDLLERPDGSELGKTVRLDEVIGRYVVHAKTAISDSVSLENTRLVLDCAHGAGYKVGPMIFRELGAEVFTLGDRPNGKNINDKIGSTYPQTCADKVIQYRADMGICLDGDADRVIVIDERGKILDGDILLAIICRLFLHQGLLKKGDEIVGTIMTNSGVEAYLKSLGLNLHRTKVGDRYILERLRQNNGPLGGEPSGHIMISNFATTGDGIVTALKILEAKHFLGKSLSELAKEVSFFPVAMENIKITEKMDLESLKEVTYYKNKIKKELNGRVVLRYSGTEPLLRLMVEGNEKNAVEKVCQEMAGELKKSLGGKFEGKVRN